MTFREFFFYLLLLVFRPRSLKTMEWRMLRLLNKDRKKHRLLAVRMQSDLRDVARKHSRDMAEKDYFDHINLKAQSPSDRLRFGGVSEVISGENLAMIGGYPNATQHAQIGLMNSPGHRANILNSIYNCVGIGVIQSKKQIYYFTQNFAKRDLILKKKVPDSISLRKGLRLCGEIFSDVQKIYVEVFVVGQTIPVIEKIERIHGEKFDFTLSFPDRGNYEIRLYCGKNQSEKFTLANTMKVKVRRGFWA